MTKNEYLQFLSMNNWVNLKRLIQMTLDDEYERMKQFDYPKINVNDILDYLEDKYLDLFTHIKIKKYIVRFTTKDGDCDKEWCYANSEEEAAQNIQDDHWDIESIDMVSEA